MNILKWLFGKDEPGTQYAIWVTRRHRELKGGCWGGNGNPWLTTSLGEAKEKRRACEREGGKECQYRVIKWNGPTSIPEAERIPDRAWAKRLNDEGVACAANGNHQRARRKWQDAAATDEAWSVPSFNLAKSYIDQGDFRDAEHYLNVAARRAENGSASEDLQVLEQVNTIRARIILQSELRRRGHGR